MSLVLNDVKNNEVFKVDIAHVDKDCENIVASISTARCSDRFFYSRQAHAYVFT